MRTPWLIFSIVSGVTAAAIALLRWRRLRREKRYYAGGRGAAYTAEDELAADESGHSRRFDLEWGQDLLTIPETMGDLTLRDGVSRTGRFANATLMTKDRERIPRERALQPSKTYLLRLDIGPLSRESHVLHPIGFPEEHLPKHDYWLGVTVTSADFEVMFAGDGGKRSPPEFLLRQDGGPAETRSGERFLDFWLTAPAHDGLASARISYTYKDTVVQSQKVFAVVGAEADGRITVLTDFTLSSTLRDLHRIPERSRTTLIANDNGGGVHEVTIRRPGVAGDGPTPPWTLRISDSALVDVVRRLRSKLASEGIAPRRLERSRDELRRDLRELVPLGREAYNLMAGGSDFIVEDAPGKDLVIQVVLPEGSSFTLPWSFVYDIFIDGDLRVTDIPFCKVVDEWDDKKALFQPGETRCRYEADEDHRENVLCPFGFWGFRYGLEVLTSRDAVAVEVPLSLGRAVIARTSRGVVAERVSKHSETLKETLTARSPGLAVSGTLSKSELRTLLSQDLPIVYFLCHGDRRGPDNATVLGIGERETVSPSDVIGWIDGVRRHENRTIWRSPRPFVFINACHSVEIEPKTLVDYVKSFVGRGGAVGVIGTEVKVNQDLAMALAERFFQLTVSEGKTVERALLEVRLEYLRKGNLFGLLYTPYCFGDTRFVA